MELLGQKARDTVTGFEGVVECVSFDLYGCVMATLRGPHDKKNQKEGAPAHWFDVKRLQVLSKKPVMQVPDFSKPEIGAADKPLRPSTAR
jgi:hypothetical protein